MLLLKPLSSLDIFILAVIAIFVSATNFALIFGLKKTNKKLTMSQKLYIYLSATDSITGLIGLPYFVISNLLGQRSCTLDGIGLAINDYAYSVSHCTFFIISYLRNLAIRKPFVIANQRVIKTVIICFNIFMLVSCTKQYFIYNPDYNTPALFATMLLYTGIEHLTAIVGTLYINSRSKIILNNQCTDDILSDINKEITNKRNRTAVSILNRISLIYGVCGIQFCIFYISLAMLTLNPSVANAKTIELMYEVYSFVHCIIFISSGANAIVYMAKDKKIKRYYLKMMRLR